MTKCLRASAVALVAVCMLSACSKPPEEIGCEDAKLQTEVRKLLAIKLERWQEPIGPVSSSNEYLRHQSPEIDATLTGLKAKSVHIENIGLLDVKEVAKPQSPLLDADPPEASLPLPEAQRPKKTGNKLLYQCTGTVRMPLPRERLADVPKGNQGLIGIEQDSLTVAVSYHVGANSNLTTCAN